MRITAIKEQVSKKRVNIYLNDKFSFGLSKEALVDCGLSEGKELTEAEIDKILEADQRVKALQKCFRWLSIRARSEKELEKKLKEKGFAPKIIKQTIERIKELGYLNDEEFARFFVEIKKINRKGPVAISRDLKQKGVDGEIIKKSLKRFYTATEEKEAALSSAKKKLNSCQNLPRQKQYQKIAKFLVGRGFSWSIVKEVVHILNLDYFS